MTKDKLVEKIKELLKADIDLNFLLILKEEELERLVCFCHVEDKTIEKDCYAAYGHGQHCQNWMKLPQKSL